MSNFTSKDKKIFADMKKCVRGFGLKIMNEDESGASLSGFSTFEYPNYNMGIIFSYDPTLKAAQVVMRYADLPADKLPALYELLNHINGHLTFNHFFIDSGTRILVLRSGFYIAGYSLNKEAFKMLLGQDLAAGHTFMPLIAKLIFTDQTPQSIMDEFHTTKDEISPEFHGPDGKLRVGKMIEELPLIVDACADMPAFATHTHGLTELGMPEFLMDLLSFGADGTCGRINDSYAYFCKPENREKLEAIKRGETIKLSVQDINPEARTEPHPYCYRRVYPEFEMVKHAYVIESPEDIDPKMWFIQIYVDGDDYALTDDYYKGGIKW